MVTGLVVNDRVNLPRERRRLLRAVRHRLANDRPATMTPAQLQGWQGLEHMIASHGASQSSPGLAAIGRCYGGSSGLFLRSEISASSSCLSRGRIAS